MSNQWGRPQRKRPSIMKGKGIAMLLLVGILAYLFFPGLKNKIYLFLKPTYAATNSINYSLPQANNSLAQNSSANTRPTDSIPTYSIQDSLSTYNLASVNKNNEVTIGYWLLFIANGQMSQLSVDAETIAFIQQLIEKDRKSTGKNTLVLFENGRSRQYMISDEINYVIANLSVIDTRVSKGSVNSTPKSSAYTTPNSSSNSSLDASASSNLNGTKNPTNPQSSVPNNSTNTNTNSNSSPQPSINQPSNSSSNPNPNTSSLDTFTNNSSSSSTSNSVQNS